MKTIIFRNKTQFIQRIILEPWGDAYDLPPDSEVDIKSNFEDDTIDFEINIEAKNIAVLWVPFETEIFLDGVKLEISNLSS